MYFIYSESILLYLLLTLLCPKFGIVKNYALFGVKFLRLKFGWCKENYIFHVWRSTAIYFKDTLTVMWHFALASSPQHISQQYTNNCVAYPYQHFSLSPTLLRLFPTIFVSLCHSIESQFELSKLYIFVYNQWLKRGLAPPTHTHKSAHVWRTKYYDHD